MSDDAKRTIRLKPLGPPSGTPIPPPIASAQPEIPGAKQTIKLRPSGLTPPPLSAPIPPPSADGVRRTIKLTPPPMMPPSNVVSTASGRIPPVMGATPGAVPTSTGHVPTSTGRVSTSSGRIPGIAGHVPTSTGKVPVMRGLSPTPTPVTVSPVRTGPLYTAPASMPPPPADGVTTASGRIAHVAVEPGQLMETATAVVPKVAPIGAAPVVPVEPPVTSGGKTLTLKRDSDAAKSTIKLEMPGKVQAASNATIKLEMPGKAPVNAGGVTVNLSSSPDDNPHAQTVKRTLSLKKTGTVAAEHEALAKKIADENSGEDSDSGVGYRPGMHRISREKDESTGGLGYTIVASLAFLGVAFLAYAAIAQFTNLWGETAAKTPEGQYLQVPSLPPYEDAFRGKLDR